MTREQLRERISEISNSCFPLIDFFNDIDRNKDPLYNKELAYQDIEKIYNVFMYYREKCEKLEEENKKLKNEFETLKQYDMDLFATTFKFKKAIEILKSMGIKLEHYPKSKNHPYVLKIKAFGDDLFFDLVNELRYNLLKEVLGNEC